MIRLPIGGTAPGSFTLCALVVLACPGAVQDSGERPPARQGGQLPGASRWDEVFRRMETPPLRGTESFAVYCAERLVNEERLAPGAEALVIAMGDGRNAVPIARRGLKVTGLDISTVAIEKAKRYAAENGVELATVQGDLFQYDFGRDRWDLVTNVYFNPAIRIFDRLEAAVKPGGFLLVEGFGSDHVGGPPEWSHYRPNQLLDELRGWRILEYQDGVFQSDWSGGGKPAPVVRVLAQKPRPAEAGDGD